MYLEAIDGASCEVSCDTLIVCLDEGGTALSGAAAAADKALAGRIGELVRAREDSGKFGATNVLDGGPGLQARQVITLGLGKREALTPDKLRAAAGVAVRAAGKLGARSVAAAVGEGERIGLDAGQTAQILAEGIVLGNYKFTAYKTDQQSKNAVMPERFLAVAGGGEMLEAVRRGLDRGRITAEAVNLARDLVNHPANYMTPGRMAEKAAEIASQHGMELNVLDREAIKALKMDAFAAVAQGSEEPPRLITLKYSGAPAGNRLIGFVGKGITFDSGGISIKPTEGMKEMKDDMAGAAAVLGAMQAIAALRLPVNILAVLPCAENMPSGTAYRPGDVITTMDSKTVEIVTTDAEGRLLLADAVTYARRQGVTHIVDLATLTGACVVALGNVTAGVMANDRAWAGELFAAAAAAGEKVWELPLFDEYKELITSDIADLKNSGGRYGGAITAAMFIAAFAGDTPWLHVDIAGVVSADKEAGYNSKGATGFGVRTLVELAAGQDNR